MSFSEDLRASALESNAWPFQEARRILARIKGRTPEKGYVLFETGYGPSGLPHIGTFGEVMRTTMVRRAFAILAPEIPTKLFAFSDDLDGLRKVPDTIPDKKRFQEFCPVVQANPDFPEFTDEIGGVSLTAIPDPFATHESFGLHMNSRLCRFLDDYKDLGVEYIFKSATDCYSSGLFDKTLLRLVEKHEEICELVKPHLRSPRREFYSPILPIDPQTKRPLHVAIKIIDVNGGIVAYRNPLDGYKWRETTVTGGNCKLQWRADWGMRWAALGVDYEMHGKDLMPSAEISAKICRILGATPPELYKYELFLDENGEKISKSKGNGLSMEDWLRYAPKESLAYYMYQSPNKAKRLYFDVIPKALDEYFTFAKKMPEQPLEEKLKNPVFHIHGAEQNALSSPIDFALLLNLASACHAEEASVLWGFVSRYDPKITAENSPHFSALIQHALHYYADFVKPQKKYRLADAKESAALQSLHVAFKALSANTSAEEIQNIVYSVGKEHGFENLREWFQALYEILLGQSQGPRFGSFVALYGVAETNNLIARVLRGENLAA
jgi:lysyl-tRNA synthetase class 1